MKYSTYSLTALGINTYYPQSQHIIMIKTYRDLSDIEPLAMIMKRRGWVAITQQAYDEQHK